jgi:hypothetical protein
MEDHPPVLAYAAADPPVGMPFNVEHHADGVTLIQVPVVLSIDGCAATTAAITLCALVVLGPSAVESILKQSWDITPALVCVGILLVVAVVSRMTARRPVVRLSLRGGRLTVTLGSRAGHVVDGIHSFEVAPARPAHFFTPRAARITALTVTGSTVEVLVGGPMPQCEWIARERNAALPRPAV